MNNIKDMVKRTTSLVKFKGISSIFPSLTILIIFILLISGCAPDEFTLNSKKNISLNGFIMSNLDDV